jgi:hypothetical protein
VATVQARVFFAGTYFQHPTDMASKTGDVAASAPAPASASEAWPPGFDALIAAPAHHTLLLENEAVRVLDTRIGPGERTPVHTHAWASVLYILSWSAFVRRDAAGQVILDSRTIPQLAISPGTLWSPPLPPHSLENVGPTDLWVISVELKQVAT